ncbi:MAG: hypothetical protein HOP33_17150 [Verrucomicrobia bacterium]|nr:hypothetical protein [Verrucomicrobiota bacterium]
MNWERRLVLLAATFVATILTVRAAVPPDSVHVKKIFANPPREYSTGPLWVWNDMLTDEQIRSTLRDLAKQRVKQVWVHPRPGLMTPYLSDQWFHLWGVALNEAEKLDMNVWIYDENSYPSGFAGGWVPELMPESRGRGLKLSETQSPPVWDTNLLAVFLLKDSSAENITSKVKAGETLGEGRYLSASVQRAKNSPWNADRCYVDLLYPGVTEKFLEVTLEAYRKHFGKEFGKRIPGSFTDEPELRPAGGLPWTQDLPEQFKKRWGYDLIESLPSIAAEIGDWKKVRHDYYQTQLDLFIERWAKPYFDYCAKNNLEFTGHYWEHEWPRCAGVPDNMAMSAWQQRPGIDILMNRYEENTHAQFGNVRSCREISSLANQFGRRTLVEVYGAGGWDLRFEDMKRIGDWLEVLGVNTLNQHVDYITIRGARKRDHPQSFSYHEPWWDAYHVSAEYLARLSAALTQGEQVNRILVLEPTTTAWMYQGNEGKLKEIGDSFFKLLMSLEAAQIEYDLGCEDVIVRHGSVSGRQLRVGQRNYDVVVLPPYTENLDSRVADLGEQLLGAGGKVVCFGDAPSRLNGSKSSRVEEAVNEPGWTTAKVEDAVSVLSQWNRNDEFQIRRATDDHGILFHMRRQLADGQLLFLVNTSIESPSAGEISSTLKGIEQLDPYTGKVTSYSFGQSASGVTATFKLPPSGSLLLFMSDKAGKPTSPALAESVAVLPPTGPTLTRRIEPNVLTLDYVDITAGGETKTDSYFYPAGQFAFKQNGLPRNPWDSAVQFKDELISKKFAPDSGFTASYKFNIAGTVPNNLVIVIERPDLYTITCNGQPVESKRGSWWLDKAFGRISIASVAHIGENIVTVKAAPFTIYHELEPAYLLGDFTLKSAEKGFIVEADKPIQLGSWKEQGHPFYSAGVAYRQSFDIGKPGGKYVVALPKWLGSVAKVSVNGKHAGYIDAPPWECDVTKSLKRGGNNIEVTVIGTLKNTLGPHHGKPALGAAWPSAFHIGPNPGPPSGDAYSTVGYGLFGPFVLRQVR